MFHNTMFHNTQSYKKLTRKIMMKKRLPVAIALALGLLTSAGWQNSAQAHGAAAHMVPMEKTLAEFGADVQWDDYARMFTIAKDGAYINKSIAHGRWLKREK